MPVFTSFVLGKCNCSQPMFHEGNANSPIHFYDLDFELSVNLKTKNRAKPQLQVAAKNLYIRHGIFFKDSHVMKILSIFEP